ncbi:MAG: sodium-translocating pyrophosphatase [Sumerlaeia bacterium]
MNLLHLVVPFAGVVGLMITYEIFRFVKRQPGGEGRVAEIAEEIQLGAMVFMKREYKILGLFTILIGIALAFKDPAESMSFFFGAICSGIAGFIGMYSATRANVRTAVAANKKGAVAALQIAFLGGSIMGLTVASMGLIGIGTLFLFYGSTEADAHIIHGFAMGASLVALFSRIGGGIFTKAADVGSDLVGKVEAGIPEDDPRNPGVIADNVGDNVGDVAGMGSDIFESYCGAQIATIAIAAAMTTADIEKLGLGSEASRGNLMFAPLALTTLGLICSVLGIIAVKAFSNQSPEKALRTGTIGSAGIFIFLALFVILALGLPFAAWGAVISGAIGGIIIGLVTEYYTGGKPVLDIAKSSETGVATVMINGLAIGMQSVAIPVFTLAMIILAANWCAGLYGVALAAVGMLSTVGITMAIDAYGPISDNAGGIAQMSAMGPETRKITDSLDEVGNTTAAIGKGFAIGAAGLAALAITGAYVKTVRKNFPDFALDLSDPKIIAGLFIGGLIPFLVASITMNAVGSAAFDMMREIRRQFREIPGLLEGTGKPDTARCVDIATTAALKKMVLPALIAVGAPVAVGFILGASALGGMLGGALLGCVLLALMMSNAGGAWDNAKKHIETSGEMGGKGSESHKACVVGDTVGDPLKDTSGPSMNILINVMAIVSLIIAPILWKL